VTDFWRDIESLTVKHGSGVRLAEVDNSLSASLQRLALVGSMRNQIKLTKVAKGSVESTHKVPTSHYHTKHRLALRSRRPVD
jgi:hypothetical protein